jgi:hypothetical protein
MSRLTKYVGLALAPCRRSQRVSRPEAKGGDMYKVKQVLTFAALMTGVAVSFMLASSAGAATVTHQILIPDPRKRSTPATFEVWR